MSENPNPNPNDAKPPPASVGMYTEAVNRHHNHHQILTGDAQIGGGGGGGEGGEGIDEYPESEGLEGDGLLDPGHNEHGDPQGAIAPHVGGNQLTLSFQGEVYVFDAVSPEKVKFFIPHFLFFF